jgi:HEAT repeat protein
MDELSLSIDTDIALSALAVLVKNDPADGVGRLDTYLAAYKGDDQHIALQTLGSELMQVADARALPPLESLSSSRFIAIRFGCVDALRKMKSSASASALAQRLDDTDRDIQFQAVLALAEIYHKTADYAPTTPLFDLNPQYYTDLWKSWLQDSGTNLTIPAPK